MDSFERAFVLDPPIVLRRLATQKAWAKLHPRKTPQWPAGTSYRRRERLSRPKRYSIQDAASRSDQSIWAPPLQDLCHEQLPTLHPWLEPTLSRKCGASPEQSALQVPQTQRAVRPKTPNALRVLRPCLGRADISFGPHLDFPKQASFGWGFEGASALPQPSRYFLLWQEARSRPQS